MAAAAVVPRFRLTFKQPLQSGKLAKSKEAKRSRPCCKRKATSRRVAVSEGTVPKARNAFALFMKQHNTAKKGASKQEFQHEMQRIAKAWAKLTQSEKNTYKEKSRSEFTAQRDAMKRHGLPTRRMSQLVSAVSAVSAIHTTCGRPGPGAPQIWEDHGDAR